MRYKLLILCFLPLFIMAQVPAFPGAEGFGMYASGGRGGHVVTVTNLQDYGKNDTPIEGSLRWALQQYKHTDTIDNQTITVYEPLTIVFNVAGNIELVEDLKVGRDNLSIFGQSAPGDGVCITGHSMLFNGATGGEMWYWGPRRKNLIVRYLRFRPAVPDQTYVTYGTDIENYENVIFDHCTMTWANEECLAIYDTKNTTVQYCLVAEGLYKANHKKGTRSYCGVWGGQFATYHHNLVAHCDSRNIRFNGARSHDTLAVVDFRNNVIYNWGTNNSGYGLEFDIEGGRCELNMVNNYYKHGPASGYTNGRVAGKSDKVNRLVRIDQTAVSVERGDTGRHYITGNYLSNYPEITEDNWYCGVQFYQGAYTNDTALAKAIFRANAFSPEVATVISNEIEDAETAFRETMLSVGACVPCRDSQDARIFYETITGTATGTGSKNKLGIIDDPAVVGGWPILRGEPYIDTDGDGIPDDWEDENGMDKNDPTDGAQITESGYSRLELYLETLYNAQAVEWPEMPDEIKEVIVPTEQRLILENGLIFIERDGERYTLSGQKL